MIVALKNKQFVSFCHPRKQYWKIDVAKNSAFTGTVKNCDSSHWEYCSGNVSAIFCHLITPKIDAKKQRFRSEATSSQFFPSTPRSLHTMLNPIRELNAT